ncbi:putative single-strand DNA-binding protein [Actinoplanes missouriensis 431]|uniref:Putative single-strand DNA-binding protein n=1 Tax=Actinoplanes missouriensis (strain ATCC 14538 / DSM 43046 / CBS 188.64 / JCM 3121 / NBRC 102363 / NCIMB 12654 / NRRL B-3342 / UNCC 431) TaxID=512565 RepID=I0GZV4_ACTM4|nr:putative single-strand DNA-binding protein [Actinoplanes missouriensis 431]
MFETSIVMVGNVLTAPEWRRIESSQHLVAKFRVASTARRWDRENNCWVDGDTMRLRVTAWRKLAEGVASSIGVGDPVIVYGRIYTRDWTDDQGQKRLSYEMEAFSIGHDLSRGRGRFFRNRPAPALAVVEDAEADALVRGEPSVAVDESEAPVRFGDGVGEPVPGEMEPSFLEVVAGLSDEPEPEEEEEEKEEETAPRRSRRGAKREPVAA